jgi:pimeloyl-ACP methyl ester carboxylesterase
MRRSAEVYREHLPQAEIHLLPDLAHLLPYQGPEAFNPILLDFLARVHASPR